jgi:hypothetical protein
MLFFVGGSQVDIFNTGRCSIFDVHVTGEFNDTSRYKVSIDNLSLGNRKSVCFSHKFFKHDMEDRIHEYVFEVH